MRCARTDKGVHASGQIVAFQISFILYICVECAALAHAKCPEKTLSSREICGFCSRAHATLIQDFLNVLNRELPEDIRAFGFRAVPRAFHAKNACRRENIVFLFVVLNQFVIYFN